MPVSEEASNMIRWLTVPCTGQTDTMPYPARTSEQDPEPVSNEGIGLGDPQDRPLSVL